MSKKTRFFTKSRVISYKPNVKDQGVTGPSPENESFKLHSTQADQGASRRSLKHRDKWINKRRQQRAASEQVEITSSISTTALDLAKAMTLAGYKPDAIRKHMPDMSDECWTEVFVPEMSMHKERLNGLAIQAMYASAIRGDNSAQKCIAIMQLGWSDDSADMGSEREPFRVTLTASPQKKINTIVNKMTK